MEQSERAHDAAPVELAAGWIAICATCGWVGETYGTQRQAAADSARHVVEAPRGRDSVLAFLGEDRRPRRDSPSADAA
ncbi:MAG: hypothetical protein AB7V58_12760 [Solirubrobacterales bacterium]